MATEKLRAPFIDDRCEGLSAFTVYNGIRPSLGDLLHRADKALYTAKADERNRVSSWRATPDKAAPD